MLKISHPQRFRLILLVGFFAAIGVTIMITRVSTSSGSDVANAHRSVQKSPAVTSVAMARIKQTVGVFHRRRRLSDVVPARHAGIPIDADMVAREGADNTLSRRAFVTPQGVGVYLVPTTSMGGGVCLVTKDREDYCAPTTAIASGEASESVECAGLPAHTVELAGMMPDGARDARFILSNGATEPVSIVNNAYVAQVNTDQGVPRTLEWTSDTGPHRAATTLPSDAGSLQCASPPS